MDSPRWGQVLHPKRREQMNYRIKFLSLWSSIMAEERWHKFDSQACIPSCKGWNAWAPLCECGKNYCRFKPSGNIENMQMVIEARPLDF